MIVAFLAVGVVVVGGFLFFDLVRGLPTLGEREGVDSSSAAPVGMGIPAGDRSSSVGRRPWLRGLVDVTPDATLVTARGVELPFSPLWEFEDVMGTLADVEAL